MRARLPDVGRGPLEAKTGKETPLMLGTVLYGPRDVRCEEIPEPKILKSTDAIIRLSASCICGSDLWPFRGLNDVTQPMAMGHEYCGVVEAVGGAVASVRPGQFVVGSFCISDNACPHCRRGFQSSCHQREFMTGAQAPLARVPLADGTLVATPELPPDDLIPSLLATSDVLGTGWYAADAARVQPGSTVAVVGDGAVGLMGRRPSGARVPAHLFGGEHAEPSFIPAMAMCVIAQSGVAPCQCFSLGSNQTMSPGRISSIGPPSRCTRPKPAVTSSV